VLLAWLNGFQDHFVMIGGMQSGRGMAHYAAVFQLADAAGLLQGKSRSQLGGSRRVRLDCRCIRAGGENGLPDLWKGKSKG
jgi:hypothetical protein